MQKVSQSISHHEGDVMTEVEWEGRAHGEEWNGSVDR